MNDHPTRAPGLLLAACLLGACLLASPAWADGLTQTARAEIDGLLARLAASHCRFQRNGVWHTADAAQVHLRRKLDHLASRGAIASTEEFIERAATRSSVSGRPYLVECGGQPALSSHAWLHAELGALRAAREDAAPAP